MNIFIINNLSNKLDYMQVPNIPSLPGIVHLHTTNPSSNFLKLKITPIINSQQQPILSINNSQQQPILSINNSQQQQKILSVNDSQQQPILSINDSQQPIISITNSRKKSILDKIQCLPEGKVLNVSNLKPNGTGARITKQTNSKLFKGTSTLKIVSDNLESYILAISMIPDGSRIYSKDIKEMTLIFNGNTNNIIEEDFVDIYPTLDLFDFHTYKEDYDLFVPHFVGVELLLRVAIWISYKYDRLDSEERVELMDEYNTKQNKYEWLENFTDVFEPQQLLYSWIKHFNPNLLKDFNKISNNYRHHPGLYFNRAYRRYFDPEWVDINLWFD